MFIACKRQEVDSAFCPCPVHDVSLVIDDYKRSGYPSLHDWPVEWGRQDSRRKGEKASGASSFNFGVDGFEFATCIIDPHLPVDSSLFCIHAARPRGDFARQKFDTADAAAVDTLTSNTA